MTREEMEKYINTPLCKELYDKLKIIYDKGYQDCKKALEQEPKTGHWIETDEWRETVDGFEQWGYFRKCNKCGYVFKFLEIDNYCPNCGARMNEVSE